jgi:hypothetical protein
MAQQAQLRRESNNSVSPVTPVVPVVPLPKDMAPLGSLARRQLSVLRTRSSGVGVRKKGTND